MQKPTVAAWQTTRVAGIQCEKYMIIANNNSYSELWLQRTYVRASSFFSFWESRALESDKCTVTDRCRNGESMR